MKFGKVLQSTAEHFPEKQFIGYKKLKKFLKTLTTAATGSEETNTPSSKTDLSDEADVLGTDNSQFIQLLNEELRELNAYFIGEEEGMVIRFQSLKCAVTSAKPEDKLKCYESLVKFHGDVVSLLHWGILNYAAIDKILKKHDKWLAGNPIRQCYLESVVHQPFYSMELVERLAKEIEQMIAELNFDATAATDTEGGPEDDDEDDCSSDSVSDKDATSLKKMRYAIRTWRDLGDNAHTPSTVLPYSKPIPEAMKVLEYFSDGASATSKKRSLPSDSEEPDPTHNKAARARE